MKFQDLYTRIGIPISVAASRNDPSRKLASKMTGALKARYEGGEALRFNEVAIRTGVKGIINVLQTLGMIRETQPSTKANIIKPTIARSTIWVRAPRSGIMQARSR